MVQGGQWVGLHDPIGSRSAPLGSQGVKGKAKRVPGGQRVGLQGPRGLRGRPARSKERGSRGRLTGSHGVRGVGLPGPMGSSGRFDGSSADLEGIHAYI